MSSEVTIRVENLSKCYHIYNKPQDRLLQMLFRGRRQYFREFWALRDVSFEVKKGETVGIIGRNGSGKSTLLQMICGTLNPTTGNIMVKGRIAALLELGAGFNPEFTGRENVYLNGAILGLSPEEINERYDKIVAFAEIGEFINQPVKVYSSGMFVRLAFAIQANIEPEILVVDEALAVGDVYFVHKCMHRFHQLREAGTTILFVSHDATAIKTICNHAIWLDEGKLAGKGKASLVVDQYLSSVVNQRIVSNFENLEAVKSDRIPSPGVGGLAGAEGEETEIPNIDRRVGDQSCVFVGVGLYDDQLRKTTTVNNDSVLTLRLTMENHSLPDQTPLIVGYSIRNHRGVDLASNNSEIEGVEILAPDSGQRQTVSMKVRLPAFHPGSYAMNISLSLRDRAGSVCSLDGITNAVVFNIVSAKQVHVLMSLETEFEVENRNV